MQRRAGERKTPSESAGHESSRRQLGTRIICADQTAETISKRLGFADVKGSCRINPANPIERCGNEALVVSLDCDQPIGAGVLKSQIGPSSAISGFVDAEQKEITYRSTI